MADPDSLSGREARSLQVAVVGGAACSAEEAQAAEEVGRRLAQAGAVTLCGGMTGVMEAACRGARLAGGTTVGVLPGTVLESGNAWLSIRLPTGMGDGRNWLVVAGADAVVAIGGEFGTLSEIALAMKAGKQVVALNTWAAVSPGGVALPVIQSRTAAEAAEAVLRAAMRARANGSGQEEPDRRS